MTPPLLVAVALANITLPADAFEGPLADAELALASSHVQAAGRAVPVGLYVRMDRAMANDQMDVWWAEDGTLLIAESVRPAPTAPAWFNHAMLRPGGAFTLRFNSTVSAVTRP